MIAGSARGRQLKGPPVRYREGVRPSSDLVRGALFDSLVAMGADFTRVLDLYAGTGALGIEALSRGADSCDFVEKDRGMAAVIRDNLAATGFSGQANVLPVTAELAMERLSGQYTLVLADPPYADDSAISNLEKMTESGLIDQESGTIALEHSTRTEPPAGIGGFELRRSLRHGDSSVSIYGPDSRGGD
ncbi:MAG TPA: RsmD family RNA methyltransferase [Dehalococcoidia bacterium]|nr:RsmD family RNA methyltransferase [Dehalococcoidia bacterium]